MSLLHDRFIHSLIPKIKEQAERILDEEIEEDADALEIQLRFWFSRHYNMPMFSSELDEYTLKEMLLEFYLHTGADKDTTENTEDLINENREELASLFDSEFSEDDKKFMDDAFGKEDSWSFSEKE